MKNTNSLADHLLNAQTYIEFHGSFTKYYDQKDQCGGLTKADALHYWVEIIKSYDKMKDEDLTDTMITRLAQSIIENDYK